MKRMILSLILVLVLSLTLCACKSKAAAAVEEQISAIGTVTLDSLDAIAKAELAYGALSDKDKESVENTAALTEAREAYTRLADASDKIGAIGEVDFDSADAVAAARGAYDALSEAEKSSLPNLDVLEAAEKTLADKLALAGSWGVEVDLAGIEEMGLQAALSELAGSESVEVPPILLPVLMTLGQDGSLSLTVDKDQFEKNSEGFMDSVCDLTVNMVYAQLAQENIGKEQADQIIQTYYGMEMRDYCMAMLQQQIDLSQLTEEVSDTGYYDIDGDKLYVWEDGELDAESYLLFTRAGDVLTVTEAHGDAESLLPPSLLPAEFTLR